MAYRLAHLGHVLLALGCARSEGPAPPSIARSEAPPDPYADLRELAGAVGDARVVAIGEPSHAEGNMFAEQARIVRFLRERLGFTVLAWEAGLWSCETDASHCLGFPWGSVVETKDARALVDAHGFHVTGFDFQFTGTRREASRDLLRARLAAAVSADRALVERLERAFGRFPKMQHFHMLTPDERATDRGAFLGALAALQGRADVPDRELLERAVRNAVGNYEWHEAVRADVSTTIDWNHAALNNVRDRAMADNVRWLLKERYAGQKIILWLANIHAARRLDFVHAVPDDAESGDLNGYETAGHWLSEALGPAYAALAMTAYEGRIGNVPRVPETAITPRLGASLERAWVPESGSRFISRDQLGNEPSVARFLGLHPHEAPWGRVFDGAIVFRSVTPATPDGSTAPATSP